MYVICEHELYQEHRMVESETFTPCPKCGKFPSDASGTQCYHCFSIGATIDECPECTGKPWSAEFLAAKAEMDEMDEEHDSMVQ